MHYSNDVQAWSVQHDSQIDIIKVQYVRLIPDRRALAANLGPDVPSKDFQNGGVITVALSEILTTHAGPTENPCEISQLTVESGDCYCICYY